jgi:toxin-antitoxin system PIN domain toxin
MSSALQPSADLPDLNVWLALAWSSHPHHAAALAYWERQAAPRVLFCGVTALGLIRLITQAKVMGEARLSASEASALQRRLADQPGVSLMREEEAAWSLLHVLLTGHSLASRDITDAWLAALALSQGLRLVSFDAGFGRFDGLSWLHLVG